MVNLELLWRQRERFGIIRNQGGWCTADSLLPLGSQEMSFGVANFNPPFSIVMYRAIDDGKSDISYFIL